MMTSSKLVVFVIGVVICSFESPVKGIKTEDKLSILTNELNLLKETVQQLKSSKTTNQCCCCCQGNNAIEAKSSGQGGNSGQESVGKPTKEQAIELLEVSQQMIDEDTLKLSARYRINPSTAKLSFKSWYVMGNSQNDYHYKKVQEINDRDVPLLGQGESISSIHIPLNNNSDNHINEAIFRLETEKSTIHAYLKISRKNESKSDVKIPPFKWLVPGEEDLVYEPGKDISLKITIPPEPEEGDPGYGIPHKSFDTMLILAQPGNTSVISSYSDPDLDDTFLYSPKDSDVEYLDRTERTLVFKTKEHPYSGIVRLMTAVHVETGSLIDRVELFKQLVIRPSTQSGAFPPGSLYTLEFGYEKKNEAGEINKFCSYHDDLCDIQCHFYGDAITSFALYKYKDGTQKEQVPFTESQERGNKSPYEVFGKYKPTYDPNEVSPVLFQCVATNEAGVTVSVNTSLTFGREVDVKIDDSDCEALYNNTVKVTCRAEGYPRPKVEIDCDYTPSRNSYTILPEREEGGVMAIAWCPQGWRWGCQADNGWTSDQESLSMCEYEEPYL